MSEHTTANEATGMDQIVSCKDCGSLFARDNAPTRMCPVCHNDGVEADGLGGMQTKYTWYESFNT
jgi:predicted Zn-ribbon and HTH transcriptional regulator